MYEHSTHAVTLPPTSYWSRQVWVDYADRLLDAARDWASPGHSLITFPGLEGGYGRRVDGLEGFARTFLLAGFRLMGERGEGLDELAAFYAEGIRTGVDPEAPDRWVRLEEHAQAKVEAASIALTLDGTRPWIWDRLDEVTRQRVIDYLAPVVGDDSFPQTNWVWFRLVVQTFLRSVGGPWSADDIAADLARHDSFVREDGWLSDGAERSYDHYVGWALQVYPVLWSRMQGAAELADGRTAGDIARLDRYLLDARALVGGDGSPLLQGRSLIYRFAAAAPFWVGAIAGVPSTSLGALRHAAQSIVEHFETAGVPDTQGLLTIGWHHPWRALAQSYSGPGSPYWAVKGLLGVALPADHPVWTAPDEPLPVESADTIGIVRSPGWIVASTVADGIVRIVNHGTDHAVSGTLVGDSPLYARLGYSTATSPLLDEDAWTQPLEQSVALVNEVGSATHRAAMELFEVRVQDDADGCLGVGSSTWMAHWLDPERSTHLHGSGRAGRVTIAGRLTVHSLVRGAYEVRIARVDELADGVDHTALLLRVGGWPVTGAAPRGGVVEESWAEASSVALASRIRLLRGDGRAAIAERKDASPLGDVALVPYLDFSVAPGIWVATLIGLGAKLSDGLAGLDLQANRAVVTWPDGSITTTSLIDFRNVASTDR